MHSEEVQGAHQVYRGRQAGTKARLYSLPKCAGSHGTMTHNAFERGWWKPSRRLILLQYPGRETLHSLSLASHLQTPREFFARNTATAEKVTFVSSFSDFSRTPSFVVKNAVPLIPSAAHVTSASQFKPVFKSGPQGTNLWNYPPLWIKLQ